MMIDKRAVLLEAMDLYIERCDEFLNNPNNSGHHSEKTIAAYKENQEFARKIHRQICNTRSNTGVIYF